MPNPDIPRCTAFLGARRVAFGNYAEVARALGALDLSAGGLLVFDDASGAQMDYPWPADAAKAPAPAAARGQSEPAAAPAVGRPRLGVVAREVTLLPRHWEWLSQQSGGASAALRRLVDEARRANAGRDAQRQATERAYRFMSAIAGGFEGFEEASRALFAHDAEAFDQRTANWPPDIRSHLAFLARDAFVADATQ
ncbi:MAG: DUF2239 family protein [Hydrogenophaga sp.]|uniref:DUF2239 family protein n=1 Tax=Hydrogenophaga sp. TaxID=1904254 RepID=UPI001D3957B8|nr:DUF2239 family protein [Hydrogenophaga sp.]MBX3610613.1 DUF2239 family protein [Hydrogenophaga sp.]